MISADMEGATGGTWTGDVRPRTEHGVPVVMVTGDDRTCEDAHDYVPAARVVAVKECVSRYAAMCLPPARTAEMIRTEAAASLGLAGRGQAHAVPHRIEVEFDAT